MLASTRRTYMLHIRKFLSWLFRHPDPTMHAIISSSLCIWIRSQVASTPAAVSKAIGDYLATGQAAHPVIFERLCNHRPLMMFIHANKLGFSTANTFRSALTFLFHMYHQPVPDTWSKHMEKDLKGNRKSID